MSKINGKNLLNDVKAMAEPVVEPQQPVNETGMDASFFDIFDNDAQTVNMSEGAAAGYYSEETEPDGFINMDGAVGVSDFGAEPSAEEMAVINSYSLEEHGPGYYTAMEEQRKGLERLKQDEAKEEAKGFSGSPSAKTIIDYADKSQDPMLLAFKDFINNPNGQTLGNLINQFSAVLTDYSKEFAANVEKVNEEKAREEAAKDGHYAPEGENEIRPGYETAMREKEKGEAAAKAAEANAKANDANKTASAGVQGIMAGVSAITGASKSNKNKSQKYSDAGIPDAIEENYVTEDNSKETGYGYGGY